LAFHIFHDQIGLAVFGVAGIDDVDYRRVMERCEELTFSQKTASPLRVISVSGEEFDGYLLLDFAVSSLGEVNGSHASGAEQSNHAILSAVTKLMGFCRVEQCFGGISHAIRKVLMAGGVKT
jgi:hypothetical protein